MPAASRGIVTRPFVPARTRSCARSKLPVVHRLAPDDVELAAGRFPLGVHVIRRPGCGQCAAHGRAPDRRSRQAVHTPASARPRGCPDGARRESGSPDCIIKPAITRWKSNESKNPSRASSRKLSRCRGVRPSSSRRISPAVVWSTTTAGPVTTGAVPPQAVRQQGRGQKQPGKHGSGYAGVSASSISVSAPLSASPRHQSARGGRR